MSTDSRHIMKSERKQLEKLRKIVQQSIDDNDTLVHDLMNQPEEPLSQGQRISDQVAKFGGSWRFIILFAIILTIWIIINATLPEKDRFDPYPFILMNLVLSCIAALQAPVIMMSQNRQEEKDRKRSENDYMINLKAELEVRSLHQKMDLLLQEQIKVLFEVQAQQMEILKRIEKKVGDGKGPVSEKV